MSVIYPVKCLNPSCLLHDVVQDLGEEEYVRQMNRPNRPWQCPKCGDEARWCDKEYELSHGIGDDYDEEKQA